MLYLLQQMYIDLNLIEKFNIEVKILVDFFEALTMNDLSIVHLIVT